MDFPVIVIEGVGKPLDELQLQLCSYPTISDAKQSFSDLVLGMSKGRAFFHQYCTPSGPDN
jgi:hypothetical protein